MLEPVSESQIRMMQGMVSTTRGKQDRMAIETKTVAYLAELARIKISEAEREHLREDIEEIISYVSQLDRLDTENLVPSFQVLPRENVWADDVPGTSLPVEEALKNAPERCQGFFTVPKIL